MICPLIEEGELPFGEDVATYSKMLKKVFAGHNVGVLHGRMSQSDKNAVFDSFAKGDTEILVSTTVVEVGVDVKNATVIVIENAERFGLEINMTINAVNEATPYSTDANYHRS